MLERQREGIAKPKAADVLRLASDGTTREEIARKLGIGVASVYRIFADAKKAKAG